MCAELSGGTAKPTASLIAVALNTSIRIVRERRLREETVLRSAALPSSTIMVTYEPIGTGRVVGDQRSIAITCSRVGRTVCDSRKRHSAFGAIV